MRRVEGRGLWLLMVDIEVGLETLGCIFASVSIGVIEISGTCLKSRGSGLKVHFLISKNPRSYPSSSSTCASLKLTNRKAFNLSSLITRYSLLTESPSSAARSGMKEGCIRFTRPFNLTVSGIGNNPLKSLWVVTGRPVPKSGF